MTMKPKPLTLPCTDDDVRLPIRELWPQMATARGIDWREYTPNLDGHMGVGFSVRLFGPPAAEPNDSTRAAYAALEDMLRALEDMGLEVTREGNEHQTGRLVLGWSAYLRAYDTDLIRYRDVPSFLGPNAERRARLMRERGDRDAAKST